MTFRSTINQVEKIMSKFLDDALALVDKVATGNADAAETKAAVADLQAKLAADEATEAETQQVVTALLNKLAASTPVSGTDTGAQS